MEICKQNGVQAVHPGYGFLSENERFAQALSEAGIAFVGPTVKNLNTFGNKATARNVAVENGVPVVPGSEQAFATVQAARDWIDDPKNNCDYPVIVKALMVRGCLIQVSCRSIIFTEIGKLSAGLVSLSPFSKISLSNYSRGEVDAVFV